MVFQQGSSHPVLASVNDSQEQRPVLDGTKIQLHSRVPAFNKAEVIQSEPMIGFKFVTLSENDGKQSLDLFNFLPVVQAP